MDRSGDEEVIKDPLIWIGIYDLIARDLGFSRDMDEHAAKIADILVQTNDNDATHILETLHTLLSGSSALVVGAGPECWRCGELSEHHEVVIAADGAMMCCIDSGVSPDIVVTDLDGLTEESLKDFNGILVLHAHGDNIAALKRVIPEVKAKQTVVTVQVFPHSGNLHIFGGFTDGDRAAYLANYFNCKSMTLVGYDFTGVVGKYSKPWFRSNTIASRTKIKKLYWAAVLISWLAREGSARVNCNDCHGIGGIQNSSWIL